MKNNALKIDAKDNVAIATQPIAKGEAVVFGGQRCLDAVEDVDAGHKVALAEIAAGEPIFRYGEPIVQATRPIKKGEWVHVHNTQPIPGDLKE
jgi:altronate hydrolase